MYTTNVEIGPMRTARVNSATERVRERMKNGIDVEKLKSLHIIGGVCARAKMLMQTINFSNNYTNTLAGKA